MRFAFPIRMACQTLGNQLFISGHSCGGIGSLRMEAVFPEVYNAAISLNPNCWYNVENDLMREFQLDEIRGAEKLDALTFHGEMDGASSYLGISSYMRWIGDKPGAEWVELPVHNSPNGREFIIKVKGDVIEREAKNRNIKTGAVEILVKDLSILPNCCSAKSIACFTVLTAPFFIKFPKEIKNFILEVISSKPS